MNKKIIWGLVATGISLNIGQAVANEYPASDFQPKVVYIDEELAGKSSASGSKRSFSFDPNYPAADYEPKVIFIDKEAASKATAQKAKVEFDPNFPAAYYQPKVIYP